MLLSLHYNDKAKVRIIINNPSNMKREKLELELSKLYEELAIVESMSEEQTCEFGNTNSKQEYIECIEEEIKYYQSELDEIQAELDKEEDDGLDPAFGSWSDFYQYMYG